MTFVIISGGQTGADRGGLDAAIELGLSFGGWAPKGWRAEDREIPIIYAAQMRESASPEYGMRTRLNVQDSDGTLLISLGAQLIGGSKYTADAARQQRKPCKHLVLPAGGKSRIADDIKHAVLDWIRDRQIRVLNIAGPRESKEPGLQRAARDALVWILQDVAAAEISAIADTMFKLTELVPPADPTEAMAVRAHASAARGHLGVFAIDPDPPDLAERQDEHAKAKLLAENEALAAEAWRANAPLRATAATMFPHLGLMIGEQQHVFLPWENAAQEARTPLGSLPLICEHPGYNGIGTFAADPPAAVHHDDCSTHAGGYCSCPIGSQ